MLWTEKPTESGTYRWRENDKGRVHSVRVHEKKGTLNLICRTMDLRVVSSSGQWCLKTGESSTDPLDGLLS